MASSAKPPVPKPRAGKASTLTKKVGPLPVWAWLLVIGGGALAGLWLRSRVSGSSSSSGGTSGGGVAGSDLGQPIETGGGDQGSGSTSGTGETSGLSPDLVAALLQAQEQGFGESLGLASSIFGAGVDALSYSEQFASQTFGESLGFAESSQAASYQFADNALAALNAGPGPSAPAPSQPTPGASQPPPPSGEQSSGGSGPVYAASYTVPTTGGKTAVVPGGPISPATGLSGHGPQL